MLTVEETFQLSNKRDTLFSRVFDADLGAAEELEQLEQQYPSLPACSLHDLTCHIRFGIGWDGVETEKNSNEGYSTPFLATLSVDPSGHVREHYYLGQPYLRDRIYAVPRLTISTDCTNNRCVNQCPIGRMYHSAQLKVPVQYKDALANQSLLDHDVKHFDLVIDLARRLVSGVDGDTKIYPLDLLMDRPDMIPVIQKKKRLHL